MRQTTDNVPNQVNSIDLGQLIKYILHVIRDFLAAGMPTEAGKIQELLLASRALANEPQFLVFGALFDAVHIVIHSRQSKSIPFIRRKHFAASHAAGSAVVFARHCGSAHHFGHPRPLERVIDLVRPHMTHETTARKELGMAHLALGDGVQHLEVRTFLDAMHEIGERRKCLVLRALRRELLIAAATVDEHSIIEHTRALTEKMFRHPGRLCRCLMAANIMALVDLTRDKRKSANIATGVQIQFQVRRAVHQAVDDVLRRLAATCRANGKQEAAAWTWRLAVEIRLWK